MTKFYVELSPEKVVTNILIANDDWLAPSNYVQMEETNRPSIGWHLDQDGYFYSPQPYSSWTKSDGSWLPPKPHPNGNDKINDPPYYDWDEDAREWVRKTPRG